MFLFFLMVTVQLLQHHTSHPHVATFPCRKSEGGLRNKERDKEKHLYACLLYFIRSTNLPKGFF